MNPQSEKLRNGGQILVAALRVNGTDTVFGVPGESALPIFDAFLDETPALRFIVCRHEANAAHMAEADAKLTGRPGICMASRGPGAMHAAIGVHTAWQNSTPMILIVGQAPRVHLGREAFQEMDLVKAFAGSTKWAAEIGHPDQIPEYVARAYQIAMHGRPGPVMLSIPEDVLAATSAVGDAEPFKILTPAPTAHDMAQLHDLLQAAQRPLMIVGGGGWTAHDVAGLAKFAQQNGLPVVAGFRCQDLLDNRDPHYIGDMSLGGSRPLAARLAQADFLLVVGDRLGEVTTRAYTSVRCPDPAQVLVHVHPGSDELGRVYNAHLPINATVGTFVDALQRLAPVESSRWSSWLAEGRAAYVEFQKPKQNAPALDLGRAILHLRDVLPDDAIVANGAGNCNIWLHRYFSYRQHGTQVAPQSGAMGYGLSAAIAAKLRHPDRTVVGFAGDGCFMMASPDFATAVHYGLKLMVLVANNAMYGSIRMHQERQFPGRPSGTSLTNPDFVQLAQSYGAHGERVESDAEFPAALERALAAEGPAILELRLDPNQLTPDLSL
ncbi:MAG: thiamine pyrophosphate-binding protein [Hyphomicrobiales bacterium]|nr:thiamine pyrophosphate-binding protein [Hyphomicrobiales bacterium]